MPPLEDQILNLLQQASYQPLKPKALARRLRIDQADYSDYRQTLKSMIHKGQIELGNRNTVRLGQVRDLIIGVYRSIRKGGGFVHPKPGQGKTTGDILIKARHAADAATGDLVSVAILKAAKGPQRSPIGRIVEIIERASDKFVGTYRTSAEEAFVRVDGGVFRESIYVGDPGVKGARDGDKVVFEMLRFPSPEFFGEGVITEVLGPRGEPGVDLLSVIRQFHLPDEFPEEVLAEARLQARRFEEQELDPERRDLTGETVITIDPPDARDFDDAISLHRDRRGFWQLGVHIADVAAFVPEGSALDREARKRGTSVYLPGKVIPMLPEVISNGLASLQERRLRYTKSVLIEFDPEARMTDVEFANTVIKVNKRLTYELVTEFFQHGKRADSGIGVQVGQLLDRMRTLAGLLRQRRRDRGFLELFLPETEFEYDEEGRITGAHYAKSDDESHRVIEEFMLTANEAVAVKLAEEGVAFLRRIHELPDPLKLKAFAEFVRSLGVPIEDYQSRFELQSVVRKAAGKPLRHAVHFSLLRSMKMATYGPAEEGHYALASDCYCHFTSPIRRYPDLTVHRLLDKLLTRGKAGTDLASLLALGEHCSFTERRSEKAERELIKIKLLEYLADHVGEEMDMIITGVEEYGFFAQAVEFPAEGLVHIRTLNDDYYSLDRSLHSLIGKQTGKTYRLGDAVRCVLWKVDQEQRELDLTVQDRSTVMGGKRRRKSSVAKNAKRARRPKR